MKPISIPLDWISPLLQIGQNVAGMTTIDATVPGKTGREVAQALRNAGIRTGTPMYVNGSWMLPVSDAEKAHKVIAGL